MTIHNILDKFKALEIWQKILVSTLGIILLPLIIIGLFLYFKEKPKDISEVSVKENLNNLNDRVERAEKKDEELKDQEETLKVEKKTLLEEVKKNDKEHSEITKRINHARSISELRAIARSVREQSS